MFSLVVPALPINETVDFWEGKKIFAKPKIKKEELTKVVTCRIELNLLLPSFIAPTAYILFIIFMKISLRNDQSGRDQDWSTWMARTASAMLCFLVVISIIVVDKNAEKV